MNALLLIAAAACTAATTGAATPVPTITETTTVASAASESAASESAAASLSATNRPTDTTAPPAITPSPTSSAASATQTPTPRWSGLCAPLEGVALSEMGSPDLLKNPFEMPHPGQDDGHHGADFAYWSRGTRKEMLGLPVYSALSGRVAGVIQNRQPYGNAVIIETRLDALPSDWLSAIPVPTPAPTVQPAANLICPADPRTYDPQTGRSLYLLYAHLNKTPALTVGQVVTCGQPIGEVGTTGRSVNPHLHLETRAGPAGATFTVMAHYTNDVTEAEMRNYCTWRVSGLFQPFDPMKLLSLQQ